MFVCCDCCVLFFLVCDPVNCDELITCPEESYRLWCVVVCDLENLKNEEAMTRVGSQGNRKKNIYIYMCVCVCVCVCVCFVVPHAIILQRYL